MSFAVHVPLPIPFARVSRHDHCEENRNEIEWIRNKSKRKCFFLRERRANNDEIIQARNTTTISYTYDAVVVFRWVSCSISTRRRPTSDHAPQNPPEKFRLFILVAQRHHGPNCQHPSSATERSRHFKCNDSQTHYYSNVARPAAEAPWRMAKIMEARN